MNKAMLLKQYMFNNKKKGGRLPSAYQEVEYIESTGTQYIDSGYNINDNKVKIQIKFRITDWNESGFYFGCGYVGGSNAFTASTNYLGIGATSINAFSNQNSMVGVINELEMEANESTKQYSYSINNGTSVTGSYSGTIKSNLSMPIFKGTLYSSCCDCRVYNFRLYANDVLMRDFIPCYRKSDNEIGLYDIVNNQFYTNQGSGSFLSGPPIVNIDGYKQLTYIESDGNAYLNTGLTWDDGYRLNAIVSKKVSGDETFCGVRTNSSDYTDGWKWKCEFLAINGSDVWQIAYNQSWLSTTSNKPQLNTYYNCESYLGKGEQYLIVDGNKIISDTISQIDNATIYNLMKKRKLFLFCRIGEYSDIDTASTQFIGSCRYAKLTLNGVVVREYIPVERNDGVVGMYDLINNTFEASSGTNFIKGDYI